MCADLCMHDRGDGNPHVHIMATTREVGPDGFTVKNREWNDRNLLLEWRKSWEVEQNRALERHYERERCAAEGREYAPVTDRARENEQIMERNALVERPGGII